MTKAPYKTKQMTEILTFLKSVQGRHVTVNEICDFFREKGISVGTTTIYRHLEKMVKEGLVAKYGYRCNLDRFFTFFHGK